MQKLLYSLSLLLAIGMFPPSLLGQDCVKLIWSDEFDGNSLDTTNWNYNIGTGCPDLCGWGNAELQYYTSSTDNVSVANGLLTITAKPDTIGGMMYTSARITTKNKRDFRYGRFEASIRLPETQGMWPAFWLLPTDNRYGEWPRSGEIDVMEMLGHKPYEVHGTVHTGLPWTFKQNTYSLGNQESFANAFHEFAVEWDPDTMRWFVDGILYHSVSSDSLSPWQPFQEDFHLILNIAVGGNWPGNPDSTTVFPQVMEVDYVRVYNQPSRLRIQGKNPVLGATGQTYSTFDIQGATYNWNVPAGASIVSGQGTSTVRVDWGCTPGDLSLTLTTDCDTSTLVYAVPAFAALDIAGPDMIAESQAGLNFSIPDVGGGTYTWTVPADATITSGQGSASITVDWGCTPGPVIVSANGNCGTALADTQAVAFPTYAIEGFGTVSEGSEGQTYTLGNIPGATYTWSVPADATIVSGQGTGAIVVDFGSASGLVSVAVSTSCGTQTYDLPVTISAAALFVNFDEVDREFGDFGGAEFEKVANPGQSDINPSNFVGKTRKGAGAVGWGGIYTDLGGEIDLNASPFLHMKVWSDTTGIVKFKLEDQNNNMTAPVELDLQLDTTGKWVNMVWDFNGYPSGEFDRIALFFNFGSTDSSYWYFDDVFGRIDTVLFVNDEDPLPLQRINLYPNPSTGKFTVELNGLFMQAASFHLELLDVQGRKVWSEQKPGGQDRIEMDIHHLPTGRYFLRLVGPDIHYVTSLMKEN
ncbi:MAG: family 16 glycosylhydrolase [Bacteroidota bacterium]